LAILEGKQLAKISQLVEAELKFEFWQPISNIPHTWEDSYSISFPSTLGLEMGIGKLLPLDAALSSDGSSDAVIAIS
jgi:hypothetical protein